MEALAERYRGRDVEFFYVYSKEPHPGETKHFRKYRQHTSYEHKRGYAGELVREFGIRAHVLVDGLDEKVVRAFGWMPNMIFIADKKGRLAYKAMWTDAPRVAAALDALLAEEEAGKKTAPAPSEFR